MFGYELHKKDSPPETSKCSLSFSTAADEMGMTKVVIIERINDF
jgi:hypothetical protein